MEITDTPHKKGSLAKRELLIFNIMYIVKYSKDVATICIMVSVFPSIDIRLKISLDTTVAQTTQIRGTPTHMKIGALILVTFISLKILKEALNNSVIKITITYP